MGWRGLRANPSSRFRAVHLPARQRTDTPGVQGIEQRWARLIAFSGTGSGAVAVAPGPSMTSFISTPRRLIRSGNSRTRTQAGPSIGGAAAGASEASDRMRAASSDNIAVNNVNSHRVLLFGHMPRGTDALVATESQYSGGFTDNVSCTADDHGKRPAPFSH